MLGQRSRAGEHEAMRKIKNEFMTHWDGLLTNQGQRILVLAATNRPFDLDEAMIRRFERRWLSLFIAYSPVNPWVFSCSLFISLYLHIALLYLGDGEVAFGVLLF